MITQDYDGMRVELPRKGLDSYPPLAQKVLQTFLARKARQGHDRVIVTRVTNQDDPRRISIYFTATHPAHPEVYAQGTYGGPS